MTVALIDLLALAELVALVVLALLLMLEAKAPSQHASYSGLLKSDKVAAYLRLLARTNRGTTRYSGPKAVSTRTDCDLEVLFSDDSIAARCCTR